MPRHCNLPIKDSSGSAKASLFELLRYFSAMNILQGPGRELVLIDEENRTHFQASEDENGVMIVCERDEEGSCSISLGLKCTSSGNGSLYAPTRG